MTLRSGPKMFSATVWKGYMTVWGSSADSFRLDEGSVAQVGSRPTDEKRRLYTSVSWAQSSWARIGDEAGIVSQVAGGVPTTTHGGQK